MNQWFPSEGFTIAGPAIAAQTIATVTAACV